MVARSRLEKVLAVSEASSDKAGMRPPNIANKLLSLFAVLDASRLGRRAGVFA